MKNDNNKVKMIINSLPTNPTVQFAVNNCTVKNCNVLHNSVIQYMC